MCREQAAAAAAASHMAEQLAVQQAAAKQALKQVSPASCPCMQLRFKHAYLGAQILLGLDTLSNMLHVCHRLLLSRAQSR